MLCHEFLGHDCEWWYFCRTCGGYTKLGRGISLGCCFLQWSRDEVTRDFYRLVFFRSVQPFFASTVAEVNGGSGLGELTFLQLSTTYTPAIAGYSVGCVFLGSQRRG